MPRTSKADRNYLSISQNTYQLYAGTDHPESIETLPSPLLILRDGEKWDSYLKVSNSMGLSLEGQMPQGMENALDCNNRTRDSSIIAAFGMGGGEGDNVITVKGGCKNLTVAGVIHSNGRVADVTAGAWSDQCYDRSTDLDFSGLTRADGKPVTFVLARCSRVKLPPRAKVLRLKSLGYEVYFWLKWAAVKVGLFK